MSQIIYTVLRSMDDFQAKREDFLNRISKLATGSNLPLSDIRLHQLPKPGITMPDNTDPEMVRKIMKVYNEVFK